MDFSSDSLLYQMDNTLALHPIASKRFPPAMNQTSRMATFPHQKITHSPGNIPPTPIADIIAALRFHWPLTDMLEIIPHHQNLYLLNFDREHDLQYVLNEGPCAVFGQPFLLKRFKYGIDPNLVTLDDYRIWFHMLGLPFNRRTEADIRFLLQDVLPILLSQGNTRLFPR